MRTTDGLSTTDRTVITRRSHPVATGLAWLSGAVATALTVLFAVVAVSGVQEWSSYVGGERDAAVFIIGFVGLLTLLAWGATVLALLLRRDR